MRPPLAIEWIGDANGHVRMIDQTRLPGELVDIQCRDVETVREAIKSLRVRGAPAIGIAAAMGVVVGVQTHATGPRADFDRRLREVVAYWRTSRPTAGNLCWALDRVMKVVQPG